MGLCLSELPRYALTHSATAACWGAEEEVVCSGKWGEGGVDGEKGEQGAGAKH